MSSNVSAAISTQKEDGTIVGRIKEMIAYVVSPIGRLAPTGSDIARLFTTAFDKYHVGVVALLKAAAEMFAVKSTGEQKIPGSYPLEPMGRTGRADEHGERTSQDPDASLNDVVDLVDDYLNELQADSMGAGAGISEMVHTSSGTITDVPKVEALTPKRAELGPSTVMTDHVPQTCDEDVIGSIDDFLEDLQLDSSVLVTPGTHTQEPSTPRLDIRKAKYAGQHTLPVPRTPLPRTPLPKLAELETRAFQHEIEVSRSVELQYSACELADRGVFLHRPAGHPKRAETTSYANQLQLRHETWIAPVNRRVPSEGHWSGVPRIEVSRPSEAQEVAGVLGISGDLTLGRERMDTALPAQVSSDGAGRRTRNRSNALWIPSRPNPAPVESAVDAPVQPPALLQDSLPVTESGSVCPPPTASPSSSSASQLARRMRGRPSSMSEWLAQLSAGANPLVDAKIAANAGPLIEAALLSPLASLSSLSPPYSPPLSSPPSPVSTTSSPKTSPPSTPVSNPEALLPIGVAQEDNLEVSSECPRRRARCSYDGGIFDAVVAPVVLDEFRTDEIGVAC